MRILVRGTRSCPRKPAAQAWPSRMKRSHGVMIVLTRWNAVVFTIGHKTLGDTLLHHVAETHNSKPSSAFVFASLILCWAPALKTCVEVCKEDSLDMSMDSSAPTSCTSETIPMPT
eukprot:2793338-Amphidinium_carterae.1